MDATTKVKHVTDLVACPGTWLRDEEAAGSNPATPAIKLQVTAIFVINLGCSSLPFSGLGSGREPTSSRPPADQPFRGERKRGTRSGC